MTAPLPAAERQALRRQLRRQGLVAQPDKSGAGHLRSFGLAPEVVFDVGVCGGTPALYRAFPQAQFVLVDPLDTSAEVLAGPEAPARAVFRAVALSAAEGRMDLRVPLTDRGPQPERASLHHPVGAMARRIAGFDVRAVPVTTLDALAAEFPGRAGLKIDTEGHEAEVLRGGGETLARCDFVILEMSLAERFDHTPRPSELIALLAAAGLEFRDVLRMTGDGRGGAAPRLIDALFTRWPAAGGSDTGV